MNKTLRNAIIAIVSITLVGLSISAFAHSGMGWGGGWGHHGSGWHHHGGYGSGYSDQLTKDEYALLEQNREAFLKETQDIRDNLYDKGRELENELAKSEPDAAKASKLQKEISKLQSQFDQKRVEHMVEMRQQNPNFGRGYMYGGRMMRDRSYRGGYCWQ
jgi:Spy/CpxP family protein refolding chaperone